MGHVSGYKLPVKRISTIQNSYFTPLIHKSFPALGMSSYFYPTSVFHQVKETVTHVLISDFNITICVLLLFLHNKLF